MKFYSVNNNPQYLQNAVDLMFEEWSMDLGNKQDKLTTFQNELTSNTAYIFLLKQDKQFIGTYKLTKMEQDGTVWLSLVLIKNDKRGLGYGGELLRHIKKTIADLKLGNVFLRTKLNGFFEKIGFVYITNKVQQGSKYRVYKLEQK